MSKKYDFIIVCQMIYPELVSTGQTLTELLEELSCSGFKIKVIASQPTILKDSKKVPKFIEYKNIEIERTWSTRFSKISFLGKLFNLLTFFISASINILIKNRRNHLILLTNPPYLPLLGYLNYLLYKSKYGVVLFDIMPEQAELINVIKPGGIVAKGWKIVNKIWYRKASYVIVLSKDMLEGALSNSNIAGSKYENLYREKTHIIHIWSDDRIIKPFSKAESREASRLKVQDKLVIQYSGNMSRFHDIETLLGITKEFANNDDVIFQYIGEGQKKRLILEFKNKQTLINMYVNTYVDKELLPDSLAMADLGVVAQLPGQERVCYPSKLLGIMAAGRPVLAICPMKSEMAEMIIANDLGFVIENGDVKSGIKVINEIKNNPNLIMEKGKNAYNYLKKYFTLHNAAQKYSILIKKYSI